MHKLIYVKNDKHLIKKKIKNTIIKHCILDKSFANKTKKALLWSMLFLYHFAGGIMIVYIEDCLIENFLVTYLLLLCLKSLYNNQTKKWKIILASVFGAVLSTVYPLFNLSGVLLVVFKLFAGVLIIHIFNGKAKVLLNYLTFIFFTALYGGINILIYYAVYETVAINDNFSTYILIILLYLIYFIINTLIKLAKKNFVICNFVYNITIIDNEKKYSDVAFLDSGNTLIDQETNSPVFIINYKLFNKLYKNIKLEDILLKNYSNLKNPKYIKSSFASGSGKILVFTVDKLVINSSQNILINNAKLGLVYSKFNKNFNCNMLLNINAFATN